MLPSSASSRKQMRQRLKSRIKPRGRPHLKQRRTVRLENFGLRFAFAIIDFLAMLEILSEFMSLEALTPAQISKKFRRVVKTIVAKLLSFLRHPKGEFEAPASASCECRLWTASPVTLFFFQPVVKKQGPLRGLANIRDAEPKVNNVDKNPNRHILFGLT